MCYLEDVFGAAAGESEEAFIVEAEAAPRWVNGKRPFTPNQAVRSELLDSFLRRQLPVGEHARLDRGEIVEFQAEIRGAHWQLKAQSVSGCLQLSASRLSVGEQERSAHPEMVEGQASAALSCASESSIVSAQAGLGSVLCPPPQALASNQGLAPGAGGEDRYERMVFDSPHEGAKAADASEEPAFGRRASAGGVELAPAEPGVPGFVEDLPYGLATGPLPIGASGPPASTLRFNPERTLILLNQSEVLKAALTHLAEPSITIEDESSVFDSYSAIDSLQPRSCIVVDVEDPSQWFSWVMRRLEQGCTVLVLCRATSEIGALRVFCGLHPELPCSRWLAEHRRVFLSSLEAVTSLFLGDSKTAVSF